MSDQATTAPAPRKRRRRAPEPATPDLVQSLRQTRKLIDATPVAEVDGDLQRLGAAIDTYLIKRG